MSDVKISGLPTDSSLDGNHYVPVNDPTGPTTKRTLLSTLAAFFFNQVNIPDGSGSPRTRMTDTMFDHVASGLVWSGDSYAVNRNASMTAGVVYINGRRISISAVSARTFTASRDTYIDILDNGDGTGSLVYSEVTNNNTSPTLAANSIRVGIIVTGATTVASAGSVNQGEHDKIIPAASSRFYAVTDSLGNLICPRDPNRRLLGYGQIWTNQGSITAEVDITGLFVPFIMPSGGRKIKLSLIASYSGGASAGQVAVRIKESTTILNEAFTANTNNANILTFPSQPVLITPSAGLHTYKMTAQATGGGTMGMATGPARATAILIELE